MSSTTKVIFTVVVLVAIIAVSSFALFLTYSPGPFGARPVTITSLELSFTTPLYPPKNGYFGGDEFLCCTPIYLRHGQTHQATFTVSLAANQTNHSVNNVTIGFFSNAFKILSTSPNPPFGVAPGTSIAMTVTLQAPSAYYYGPVTIFADTS